MTVPLGVQHEMRMVRNTRQTAVSEFAQNYKTFFEKLIAESTLSDNTPRLSEYGLGHFDPKIVIERLLTRERTYFALKDILFAGLSAWTVSPGTLDLASDAMVLAGVSRLADLEEELQSKLPKDPILPEIIARLTGPGIDFYRDFYYPAGGSRRVLQTRSPKLLSDALVESSKEIPFAIDMMRVLHYHALNLQDRSLFRPASIESGSVAVSALRKLEATKTLTPNNCKKKSSRFRASETLLYAAHTIKLGDSTLLGHLQNGRATFKEHGHLLENWIARAVYIASHIVAPMYSSKSAREQTAFLPDISPTSLEAPDLGSGGEKVVRDSFAIKTRKKRTR